MLLYYFTLALVSFSCLSHPIHRLKQDVPNSVSGTPYVKGSKSNESISNRIEFQTVTVDDMNLAFDFYVNVLGGVEIDFCKRNFVSEHCLPEGGVRINGLEHLQAYFGYEIAHNEEVPRIDTEKYFVWSRFILFGNAIMQLIQFHNPKTKSHYELREPLTSPCYIGAAHICFWIEDSVDMNDYIASTESIAEKRGMQNVAWNRPVPQTTREDRKKVPKSQYCNKVTDGAFEGLEWSYFKGPIGEQLELYRITDTMKNSIGRAYCERGGVSQAFVDNFHSNASKPISSKLYGVFQFGFRTDDLDASVGFYTEVLGGDLIEYPTHGIDIRGDDAHWMILANETLEAYTLASNWPTPLSNEDSLNLLGVANISSTGSMRLDHRFILFDNFVVEPLLYTSGHTFGAKKFNPRHTHSTSPAYIGAISAAFGFYDKEYPPKSLKSLLKIVQNKAKVSGFDTMSYFPQTIAEFPDNHPYSGFSYGYGKGPSGESIVYINMKDNSFFKNTIYESYMNPAQPAVSTLFASTNVYNNGQMDKFCNSL